MMVNYKHVHPAHETVSVSTNTSKDITTHGTTSRSKTTSPCILSALIIRFITVELSVQLCDITMVPLNFDDISLFMMVFFIMLETGMSLDHLRFILASTTTSENFVILCAPMTEAVSFIQSLNLFVNRIQMMPEHATKTNFDVLHMIDCRGFSLDMCMFGNNIINIMYLVNGDITAQVSYLPGTSWNNFYTVMYWEVPDESTIEDHVQTTQGFPIIPIHITPREPAAPIGSSGCEILTHKVRSKHRGHRNRFHRRSHYE